MPQTLATCEVYGTIFDVFGVPVEGAIVGCMSVYKNGSLVLIGTKEVSTDVDGYFTMDLPRGPNCVAILYANTPGLNISALGTPTAIPDADSAELAAIIGDFELWNEVPIAIPGGASIGTPIGGGTPQAILFINSGGGLGQDPPKLMYDGAGVLLPGPPTLALHATPRSYVDSAIAAIPWPAPTPPAGTATEIQYRLNATTFGAVAGTAVGTSTNWPGTPRVQYTGVLKVMPYGGFTTILELASSGGGTFMAISEMNNAFPPCSAFYAIHSGANKGIIYYGRGTGGFGNPECARQLHFYTGPTGAEDNRRMFVSSNGSVQINQQTISDGTAALTVNASGARQTFAKALQVNGVGEMSADPTTPLGIATKQFVESHGATPAGSATELQYRLTATTFGAVPGSSYVAADPMFQSLPTVSVSGAFRVRASTSNTAVIGIDGSNCWLVAGDPFSGALPMSVFQCFHNGTQPSGSSYLYIGRGTIGRYIVPYYISFYTGATGTEDVRRLFISPNGSIVTNQQGLADATAALTVNASGNATFAKALQINGNADMATNSAYRCLFGSGNASNMLYIDGSANFVHMGPETDYSGGIGGSVVVYACGTGSWSSSSFGACIVNYGTPYPFAWDFNAHVIVRGALTLSAQFGNYAAPALNLANNVPIRGTFPNTATPNLLRLDNLSQVLIGPETDANGGTTGYAVSSVQYLCGTGPFSATAYGAAIVYNTAPGSWDFNSNMQVRGAFEAGNAAVAGSGFCVGTLGRVGFGVAANGGTTQLQIRCYDGWNGIFFSDLSTQSMGISLSAGVWGMATAQVLSHYGGAGLQLSGAAAGVKIYDGAAYKQIKFGPAGSGPGGVGRAIYID